jgi:hypothetical protein
MFRQSKTHLKYHSSYDPSSFRVWSSNVNSKKLESRRFERERERCRRSQNTSKLESRRFERVEFS